ncbi:MAG: transposase [Planctomycetes bacterium]|nr:transposase [Planctomycetota bacterium]
MCGPPHSARLYFRNSQLPTGETFRKKTELAPELLRQADAESNKPILAPFDGAYANETVIRPCLFPEPGGRRIDVVTRLRFDARLYHRLIPNSKGRPRKWGRRITRSGRTPTGRRGKPFCTDVAESFATNNFVAIGTSRDRPNRCTSSSSRWKATASRGLS